MSSYVHTQTAQEEFLATKGEAPTTITTDDAIGPEMAALENVVKQLGLDSWEVENTQQVCRCLECFFVV